MMGYATGGGVGEEIKYKGKLIKKLHPSGYYEVYSDKEERFLKFDDLDSAKELVDSDFGSTKMKYPKSSYGSGGQLTNEDMVRQSIVNGEIHSDILEGIIGHKPNYPNEIVGTLKLKKCFLKPYYRID